MAVLVGILLGLSRLAADSEIIAMRASGLGIGYFVRVASVVAIGGTLLGLVNSLYIAPRANRAILDMQQELETSQASYEIQPRVFYEDFRNAVLYVQNVRGGTGASNWDQVFMADVTDPGNPIITTATSATVVNDSTQELLMRLRDGSRHETVAGQPEQYNISTFEKTDLPLSLSPQSEMHLGRMDTAIYALPMDALEERTHGPDGRRFLLELHTRLSYPVACLVLMLVGVPLGVISRRGGKSSGLVFTVLAGFALLHPFVYRHRAQPPGKALAVSGSVDGQPALCSSRQLSALADGERRSRSERNREAFCRAHLSRGSRSKRMERISRNCSKSFSLARFALFRAVCSRAFSTPTSCASSSECSCWCWPALSCSCWSSHFSSLSGDILRNHIALATVGDYFFNLAPSMVYAITPLAVLIAALVTFGVLNRNSEIVAMKATGISLYRLVIPIVSISAILAICLFLFDDYYLPPANRRQEALRSTIKGRPPQTFLHPEEKWMFGQSRPGEQGRIFYYQFFDADDNAFANLSIFEFNPSTFALSRRIFASRVVWDERTETWRFDNGWVRNIDGNNSEYSEFRNTSFCRDSRRPRLLQKRESAVAGDELRPARPLHSRSAPERV